MITNFHNEFSFLSNFHPVNLKHDDIIFPSLEHAFVAMKTTDINLRKQIALITTPGKAKRFGRKVVLRENWEDIKLSVMIVLIDAKFNIKFFSDKLIATGNQELIEGNTWGDKFWGAVLIDNQWVGENHLGKILMAKRNKLQND